jgi:ribulose 1,5-bisphosphate synthetase/thiazole synthase
MARRQNRQHEATAILVASTADLLVVDRCMVRAELAEKRIVERLGDVPEPLLVGGFAVVDRQARPAIGAIHGDDASHDAELARQLADRDADLDEVAGAP